MRTKRTRQAEQRSLLPALGMFGCLLLSGAAVACGDDTDTGNQGGGGGTSQGSGGSGGATSSGSASGGNGGEAAGQGGGGAGQGGEGGEGHHHGGAGHGGEGGEGHHHGGAGHGGEGGEGQGGDGEGGSDTGEPWDDGFAGVVALDDAADDRLWAVTFDEESRAYGAGHIVKNGDSHMVVARFDTDGALDATFGTNGVATVNVVAGGTVETARGVVLQSDGKVVIAGNVEHDPTAAEPDADIAVVRFHADGTLDETFGTDGIVVLDLGEGAGNTGDLLWGIDRDADDRLVLFASKKADGRSDRDRVVARLTADGALDETFATGGFHVLDVDNLNLGDNPRNGFVQADGKIVSSGYASVGGRNQIVLLRLNEDGTPDTTFSSDGVARLAPFAVGMAEAYGAARQSNGKYVTTGYGRSEESGAVDLVSFRVTANGGFDTSWGVSGGVVLDIAADNDRGRNLVTLPDDRVFMVGSGTPAAGNIDAMAVVLEPNGAPDTRFAVDGYRLYSFDRADEAFFGVAVSPDGAWVAATGYRSDGNGPEDDDSLLLLLPVAR